MSFWRTSVFRKQVVAVSGLLLIGFILGHLYGNFHIFGGPEALNGYSDKLHELGALLWVVRAGLLAVAVIHIYFTVLLTLENRRARGQERYDQPNSKGTETTEFAKKTMILSGGLMFIFIVLHLADFTFVDRTGPRSVVGGELGAESLGLYGVVWKAFTNPLHSFLYIVAVCLVGMHLTHGLESLVQTLGFRHPVYTLWISRLSIALGVLVAAGYSLIPLYVMASHYLGWGHGVTN